MTQSPLSKAPLEGFGGLGLGSVEPGLSRKVLRATDAALYMPILVKLIHIQLQLSNAKRPAIPAARLKVSKSVARQQAWSFAIYPFLKASRPTSSIMRAPCK